MIYNDFKGIKLSALGMGTMRLPVKDGDFSKIDTEKTAEMIDYAIKSGINYFDTAWGYHDGMSETTIGEILSKYNRESFYLATKFPGYDINNMDKVESIFEAQLKKCRVDYFDFYLFHNLCEMNINEYLDEKFGIYDYLMRQKRSGRIKYLGVSVHGSFDVFKRFLDAYGKDIDFCQIQLNYVDYKFQKADEKIKLLNELNIPIWVMEPLRGGKLASLNKENERKLELLCPGDSMPKTALRFVQSIPGVTMILSGMSDMKQLEENIDIFSTRNPMDAETVKALIEIGRGMVREKALPCTGCRYCTSHCPQQIDIPFMLELYNEHSFTQGGFIAPMAMEAIDADKQPTACIGCKSCEAVCPQQLKIAEIMSDFAQMLENAEC